jgi:hypothetical protein
VKAFGRIEYIHFHLQENHHAAGPGICATTLGLSGPSGHSTDFSASGGRVAVGTAISAAIVNNVGNDLGARNRSLAHSSDCLSRARCLAILLIGCEVERDEEHEVRAQSSNTSKCGKLLTGTMSSIWHPLEVGGGEVGVGCEVYET